jgi:hypothetical protein
MGNQIVAEALTWMGTPYQQGAAIKGVGVDSTLLVVSVLVSVGFLPDQDYTHITPSLVIADIVERGATQLKSSWPEAGTILVYRDPDGTKHLAICEKTFSIIYASRVARFVVANTHPDGFPAKKWVIPEVAE